MIFNQMQHKDNNPNAGILNSKCIINLSRYFINFYNTAGIQPLMLTY